MTLIFVLKINLLYYYSPCAASSIQIAEFRRFFILEIQSDTALKVKNKRSEL